LLEWSKEDNFEKVMNKYNSIMNKS
jgi:hypothetical protein